MTKSGRGVLLARRVDGLHPAAVPEHAGGGGEMLQGRAVRDRDDQGIELRVEVEYLIGGGTRSRIAW